jgi:ribosomal protein S24E
MKMKIIKQEKSNLLPRIDVIAEIAHLNKRTPSNEEVREELSKLMKVDKELILIKHIYTGYGSDISKIEAYAYNSKEDMDSLIKKGKKEKEKEAKALEEAKKKVEESKAAAVEKAKAEEESKQEETLVKENKVEGKNGEKTSEE